MKLVASVLTRRFRTLPRGTGFTLALCVGLIGLDLVGRFTFTTDIHDGLAAFTLLAIGLAVPVRHRRDPLPWVRSLAGWGRRVVGYAVMVSAVAWAVPPAYVIALCLTVAVGAFLVFLLPGKDGAAVLWRGGAGQTVYAVPLHRVLAAIAGLSALVIFNLLLTA